MGLGPEHIQSRERGWGETSQLAPLLSFSSFLPFFLPHSFHSLYEPNSFFLASNNSQNLPALLFLSAPLAAVHRLNCQFVYLPLELLRAPSGQTLVCLVTTTLLGHYHSAQQGEASLEVFVE